MKIETRRNVTNLEQGWKFTREIGDGWSGREFDDSGWESVTVPHDWAIGGEFDFVNNDSLGSAESPVRGWTGALPHVGKGAYRLSFTLPEDLGDSRVTVEFDGIMSHSEVYCNGQRVGGWPYGYTSFAVDLTSVVSPGENTLAVSAENFGCMSRWYPGAGIYRNARLVVTSPVHVAHWGTTITTPRVDAASAEIHVRTEIDIHTANAFPVTLETQILDPGGKPVAAALMDLLPEHGAVDQSMQIDQPTLWSLDTPLRYTARSIVRVDGDVADEYETPFGIRSLTFCPQKGFLLNEESVRFNGVCMHHDLGPIGTAVNVSAMRRQLSILQEMGCNAIRTSHNPPAPELLELADTMGMLIIVEFFDEWRNAKMRHGYHKHFDQWARKDVQATIRRDRNHPSVIMWSLGNEVSEERDGKSGQAVCRLLHDIAHETDPTRPTTCGLCNPQSADEHGLGHVVDVPGWNYLPRMYSRYHSDHPTWPMYGSETSSCVSSRGEYFFTPMGQEKSGKTPNFQVNSYDLDGNTAPDVEFSAQDENQNIMGEFVWTGFDYLGEPAPYEDAAPTRSSYFGPIDLCGLPKDRFYLYQSRWTDADVLHLLPHWTWPEREGKVTPVHCYSRWDDVELFVNGVSQGKRKKQPNNLLNRHRLVWDGVEYQPGELRAVAYDSEGKVAKECVVRTAGPAAAIRLTADRDNVTADGKEMAFVTVEILDAAGELVPRADHAVTFAMDGPMEIVAVGNGDSTNTTPFASHTRNVFSGKCVAYLRSRQDQPGTVTLRVTAKGLEEASVEFTSG